MLVFEAINDHLKEIFVGVSELPMFEMIDRLRERPPQSIRHWKMKVVEFRSVEFDLGPEEAAEFLKEYVKRPLPCGWRFLIQKFSKSST